jgi:hypothetical protein
MGRGVLGIRGQRVSWSGVGNRREKRGWLVSTIVAVRQFIFIHPKICNTNMSAVDRHSIDMDIEFGPGSVCTIPDVLSPRQTHGDMPTKESHQSQRLLELQVRLQDKRFRWGVQWERILLHVPTIKCMCPWRVSTSVFIFEWSPKRPLWGLWSCWWGHCSYGKTMSIPITSRGKVLNSVLDEKWSKILYGSLP